MSIGLLSMTPINSRSVISHMRCWSRTSSLALELEEKPLDSMSSQMASNSTASSSSLMRLLVSQTGPGAWSEHTAATTGFHSAQ